jgi:zinc protease
MKGSALNKGGAEITEHTLRNGLRVLIAERHSDPVVAVITWYRVGARNEREDEAGLSHFLEHMMFKGSKRFGKGVVDRITTELGGSNNAFTSYDHTAYWFELASDRWEKALEIEADRMRHLTLDGTEFAAEREVVLEELSMGIDDPWRRLTECVQAALFSRHPYRRPIIGHDDALNALDVADMRDYYRRFYHPGNAVVVVCGDVKQSAALKLVRKHFGGIPAGKPYEQADCFRPAPDVPPGELRLNTTWDDQGRRLCMVWPSASVGADDDWTLDVISSVLTGGRTSRLVRRLVLDEALATTVSTHNDTRVESGVFWLIAECAQGVEPEALERAIDTELDRLTDERVTAKELRRVRSMLGASEAFECETVSDLAETIGEFAVDADWRMVVDGMERIRAVDAKRVQDCARRLLRRDRRVVGWCLPGTEDLQRNGSQ